MLMKKYIFGTTQLAEVLSCFLWDDEQSTGGYIVDEAFINQFPHLRNVVSWENFIKQVKPDECEIYIAIGYNRMNTIREDIYNRVKNSGYKIGSFVHPSAVVSKNVKIGEGCLVFENATIQPNVVCGVCNIFWSNVNICHHTEIGNFNFFAASSAVLGRIKIGNNCFIGCNATIKNEIMIGDKTLIGAGTYCSKNTNENDVIVPVRSLKLDEKSIDLKI